MTDLNMMMRDAAKTGLETQLATAVTNGDIEAATKASDELAKLAVATAPKAPPYGEAEIRAELNKLDWFGTDPKKTGRVLALGKDMDPKKFDSAKAFTDALVKSVDAEFPAPKVPGAEGDDNGEETDDTETGDDKEPKTATRRKTDGPGDGDSNQRSTARRTSGPWTKITDAPADVQKEIKRAADKFVPTNAPKESREKYISKALESHYAAHERKKGKK